MIRGRIAPDGRAVVRVTVAGHPADVVIDTGLDAGVSLPGVLQHHLNLTKRGSEPFQMADGTVMHFDVFEVEVEIDGATFTIDAVLSTSTEVLLGVKALADYRLTIDYPAGTVTLQRARP